MSSDVDEPFDVDINYRHHIEYLKHRIRRLEDENRKLMVQLQYYKSQVEKLISPPLIEATIIDVLRDGRVLVKSSTGPNLVVDVLDNVPRDLIRIGQHVLLNTKGSAIVEVLPEYEDPYVKTMEVIERPNVSFSDIGGLKEQIMELKEVVELPLKHPEMFEEIGIEPPKGVLLYGPPGCGKTLLAKAVAHEAGATFISIVGSELVQKFIGEGARIVREVFRLARKKAPSIVFIDEIDAIAARRLDIGTSGEREVQRTLMQLLAEIDGFKPLDNVKIIAATNRIDILDPAILRPGRFDRLIEVPLPDLESRIEIFHVHTRRMKLAEDVDIEELARLTDGATGAEIKAIVTEAGYYALRNGRKIVLMDDFLQAVKKIMSKKEIRDSNLSILSSRRPKHRSSIFQ